MNSVDSIKFYSWDHELAQTHFIALTFMRTEITLTYLRNIVPPSVPLLPGQHCSGRASLHSVQTVFYCEELLRLLLPAPVTR